MALGLASLFVLGDSIAGNDPSTFLVAGGVVAAGGAVLGAVAGRFRADRASIPDRVRTETFALGGTLGGTSVRHETRPAHLVGSFAPTLRWGGGRVRLLGHVGGDVSRREDVDPRPQLAGTNAATEAVRRSKELSIGIGLDVALGVPYPLMRPHRSMFLGRLEVRWKPDAQIRRVRVDPGDAGTRWVETTMLLPLTMGIRWHVSPRQRFTVYLGPRFDFVAFRGPDDDRLRRGRPQVGAMYGEAWYEVDVPLQDRRKPHRTEVNGLLGFGYVHSRLDGGFDFGSVVGFLGTIHANAQVRIRPHDWPVALGATLALAVADGTSLGLRVGVSLPDIRTRSR